MRPLIGITTYVEPARWGYWELEAALIPQDYVESVENAGGRALLVPPSDDAVEETLDALDGIVFTGGADIDPKEYGAEAHAETFGIRGDRDRSELALMRAALERDMPVLGICRGIQVLNVARGGDLHQHLPDLVGHEQHKHDPPGVFNDHEVEIAPETRLASILGDTHDVKSHHHQGLAKLGEGLVEAARADDGTVEAIEDPGQRFALGVLWHPEAGENKRLFEALVEEARRYRAERRGS
ncbi:MAG TPA: gamma-glutamyl-gamma-aminobutyrate hydrolase family protein [Gaiellaceae bacterium]